MTTLDLPSTSRLAGEVLDEVNRAIVGKRDALTLVLCGVLAGGHVLLDDVPGVAKTLAARSLARASGLPFSRIQFTPDLLPSDVTGVTIYDPGTKEFEFHRGPIFATIVLADEINRASPKTQSALLEVMEEGRVTVDGDAHPVPSPFMVVATQNPVDLDYKALSNAGLWCVGRLSTPQDRERLVGGIGDRSLACNLLGVCTHVLRVKQNRPATLIASLFY